jgi:hypothetical protein
MIITTKSPNAMNTHLYDADGNCITKMYVVMSYDTETGDIEYYKIPVTDRDNIIRTKMPGLRVVITPDARSN